MNQANLDFIGPNGAIQGDFASYMNGLAGKIEPGRMRPWLGADGNAYITVYAGGDPKKAESYKKLQINAATLRRDEWK